MLTKRPDSLENHISYLALAGEPPPSSLSGPKVQAFSCSGHFLIQRSLLNRPR